MKKTITSEKLDRIFDEGKEDITDYMDLSSIERPNLEKERINVDFPKWMIRLLDKESQRLGVPRQAIIKVWIADRLEKIA